MAPQPAPPPSQPLERARKKSAEAHNRQLNFTFSVGTRYFSWKVAAGAFGKLPLETRFLMATGQANVPGFATDAPSKNAYILRLVNKGLSSKKNVDTERLQELAREYASEGLISNNGNGPELTDEGLAALDQKAKDAKLNHLVL